jgi:hypothetical protein
VPAGGLEREVEALGVALGERLDVLRPLALAARMGSWPAVMMGMGRHGGCSLRFQSEPPDNRISILIRDLGERGFLTLPPGIWEPRGGSPLQMPSNAWSVLVSALR